jgi:hypothetical protein
MFSYEHSNTVWKYQSVEERESEYEWILSQLDCRVNDGGEIKVEAMVHKYKYYLNNDLELSGVFKHQLIIQKGTAVYSSENLNEYDDDDNIKISHKGTIIWCDVGRLSLNPIE